MRTRVETIYTAAELKAANPRGFERALEWWRRLTCEDPAWSGEYHDSLRAALKAVGSEPPRIDGPTGAFDVRRSMAWLENNVLGALRDKKGNVRCCPWTGYCMDDDLLDAMREHCRSGGSPHELPRVLQQTADRLWKAEVESQCSEEYFLDAAEANGYEFTQSGELA